MTRVSGSWWHQDSRHVVSSGDNRDGSGGWCLFLPALPIPFILSFLTRRILDVRQSFWDRGEGGAAIYESVLVPGVGGDGRKDQA